MTLRITNGIINNNAKNNLNVNKANYDKMNTMVATGQKITRPSDDPIIAIRALRLNSTMSELNQYYDKNIPDAEAWLKTTESALTQTDSIITAIRANLTTGASDDNTAEDRMNILDELTALREQIYSAGNADYADRSVFTGYRTGEALTFLEESSDIKYSITETFTSGDVDKIQYVSGDFDVNKADVSGLYKDGTSPINEQAVSLNTVVRVRLSYDKLDTTQNNLDGTVPTITTKSGNTYTPVIKTLSSDQAENDALYTGVGADDVYLIADTGELILGENVAKDLMTVGNSFSIEYSKSEFNKGELRPEHYFACQSMDTTQYVQTDPDAKIINYNYDDLGNPDFQNQKIKYEIAYNQSIEINANANEVYTHNMGRDIDELLGITQHVVDMDAKIKELKAMQEDQSYSDAEQEKIADMLKAANKERDYYKETMQQMFAGAITKFSAYQDRLNVKISDVGALRARVDLTKERVSEQRMNFAQLQDENININLTDSAIDLKSAQTALEAAQAATAKISQQSLLNYI